MGCLDIKYNLRNYFLTSSVRSPQAGAGAGVGVGVGATYSGFCTLAQNDAPIGCVITCNRTT